MREPTRQRLSPQSITPPTGEPIRVGILHSLTGTMAHSESPVADATLLAIDEMNRDGGLLGRPVEGVVADGRSDSAAFAREAERLIKRRACMHGLRLLDLGQSQDGRADL